MINDYDLTNLDFFVTGDPHSVWKELRATDPVHWTQRENKKPFWSITKYDDAQRVYRDPASFSSHWGIALGFADAPDPNQPRMEFGFGQMMITTDPPRHGQIRQMMNRRFTPRALAPHELHVRAITTEIIDAIAPRGECDLVVDVAARLPTAVICEMLGVPREDWDMMFALGNMALGGEDPEYQVEGSAQKTGVQAQMQIFNYFMKLISERRANPGDDLVSAIVNGEIEGDRLSDIEVLFNCFLLILGGQETTRNAITGGMNALMHSPADRDRLSRDPSLMPTAIEEILRWTSPITHIMRTATCDVEIRGRTIHKDDRVVIWNPSANRDEDVFADPYKFDITRHPNDHLAFGYGEHFCIGANLARLELRVMLDELLRRVPDMAPAGPPEKLRSNLLAGIKHLPVTFSPVKAAA
ncbi:MAG TPA: cytochrome P450 [Candidatus Binataceae bacterium]|nr:cytochrome P450 [Candidatus Binataceae bacterium]